MMIGDSNPMGSKSLATIFNKYHFVGSKDLAKSTSLSSLNTKLSVEVFQISPKTFSASYSLATLLQPSIMSANDSSSATKSPEID